MTVHVVALDFVGPGGTAGFVRLEVRADDGVAWWWTYLVGPGIGLVVVRDHDVPPPRVGLEVRSDGLWGEAICETPGEHWSFGLEAFGLRLDDPRDALASGGEVGERVPVGLDLGWEVPVGAPGGSGVPGAVHGELLVGPARIAFDGTGRLATSARPTDWSGEPDAVVAAMPSPPVAIAAGVAPDVVVPLGPDRHLERGLSADPPGWWTRLCDR